MLWLLNNFKICIHLFNNYLLSVLQRDEEMRNSIPDLKKFRVGALASISQWLECQPAFGREEG